MSECMCLNCDYYRQGNSDNVYQGGCSLGYRKEQDDNDIAQWGTPYHGAWQCPGCGRWKAPWQPSCGCQVRLNVISWPSYETTASG